MRSTSQSRWNDWKDPMPVDGELRSELLAMADEDQRVRAELAADASLFEGYHPRMEEVHRRNGARLQEIIERHGWPGRGIAGEDGAAAAWLVLQHAISMPSLQRMGLRLLKIESLHGEVDPAHVAMLEDRIRFFEGRPQVYGTQYDWDAQGEMSPSAVEDLEHVEERRKSVGLPPLAADTRRMRDALLKAGAEPPRDLEARRAEQREWARSVGWLDP